MQAESSEAAVAVGHPRKRPFFKIGSCIFEKTAEPHVFDKPCQDADLRARQGAPETFDARGFVEAVQNLALGGQAAWPGFDRSLDAVVPDALAIPHDVEVLLVEGNYLLLDQPVWRDLAPLWDLVFWIEVDEATLLARLIQRWLDEGLTPVAAEDRARTNDLVNARTVQSQSHLKNAVVLGA